MSASTINIVNVTLEPVQLRLENAALYLDMPYETLRALARQGKVPCVKIGRAMYFLKSDLDNFVNECRIQKGLVVA